MKSSEQIIKQYFEEMMNNLNGLDIHLNDEYCDVPEILDKLRTLSTAAVELDQLLEDRGIKTDYLCGFSFKSEWEEEFSA